MTIWDDFTMVRIGALRDATFDRALQNNTPITNGIYASWDDIDTDISIQALSSPGMLLTLNAHVPRKPRWLVLNFEIGRGQFDAGDILLLIVEGSGLGEQRIMDLVIRSATKGGLVDTPWRESLILPMETGIATALHSVEASSPLVETDAFHTVMIRLPVHDFSMTFRDLRLTVIPADCGFQLFPPTLGVSP